MRELRPLLLSLALLVLCGTQALAQRRITGRVTGEGGTPLASASVQVLGTALGTYTGDDGRYALVVPEGALEIRVRRIGYRQQTVPLPAGQNTLDVVLERDVLQLEGTIVTGSVTSIAKQNAANDVAVVNAEVLNAAPTQTVESALQGKVAGAVISANSGAPGGGMQIQLRGVTSINASADPLFVVDGVVVSNLAIAQGTNAVTLAASGGNASNQDNPVNRIADLNPADIERIEILKGASASAIYGSKASNGVIIITTKSGGTGRPQFNLTQRVGTFDLSNKIEVRNWTLQDALASAPVIADSAQIAAWFADGKSDHQEELFGENSLSYETNLSVRGGTQNTKYFVSGLIKEDAGIMKGTGYNKQSLRVNLTQLLAPTLTLNVNTNLVHSLARRGLSNNDNAFVSPYMVLSSIPDFYDLRARNGIYPPGSLFSNNPVQTRDLMRNDEDVYRFIGSGSVRWDAYNSERQNLVLQLDGGVDQFAQRNSLYFPPELYWEPDDGEEGTAGLGNHNSLSSNVNLSATHSYYPASRAYTATTSVGLQRANRKLLSSLTTATQLFAGQRNVDQGANIEVDELREQVRDFAMFAQEELLTLDERLLLTAGLRAERSTANGDAEKFYLFPKASASYRIPDVTDLISQIKLRAAVGQSGNQPFYGQRYTRFATGNYLGRLYLLSDDVKGAPDIAPEVQTEIEGGVDATLWNERASVSVTLYQKTIDDLILERTPAPSSGYSVQLFNAGAQLRNRGTEIAVAVTPWQTEKGTWISRTTFAKNEAVVTKLPVPAFETGGFGTSLGAFKIEKGKSATQIVGYRGSDVVQIGDASPDFTMSFSNELTYGQWRVYGLFDWKRGGDVINLTQFLFDIFGNSADFGDSTSAGFRRINEFGSNTAVYVQDGSFVKLRELTVGYTLPEQLVASVFRGRANTARIELSGRNLYTWTPYVGLDPEVSNFGNQQIARNIDVAPFPPSRSFFLSLDVGF